MAKPLNFVAYRVTFLFNSSSLFFKKNYGKLLLELWVCNF